jgi:hypothetical protein
VILEHTKFDIRQWRCDFVCYALTGSTASPPSFFA